MKCATGLFILAVYMPYVHRVKSTEDDEAPLSYPVADRLVPCKCWSTFEPVCGSDGNDYPSECLLHCVSNDNVCNGRPQISVASVGVCPAVTCKCAKIITPVCGTDDQTYANGCRLRCENARRAAAMFRLPPIKIAYRGICGVAPCICPDAIIPVCGTDGKSYRNICVLKCNSRNMQAQKLPQIELAGIGPCKKETCVCPTLEMELCASDGETYYNQCALDCVNRKLVQLGKGPLATLYPGPCIGCVCASVVDLVCASDGKTYGNACELGCVNQKRKRLGLSDLKLLFKGECGCICPREYRPLCASDHRTKANACLLACENSERQAAGLPSLRVVHEGGCNPCDCRYCSPQWKPVCGSDRHTYWNICRFSCNNDCRASYGLTLIKKVSDTECC